MQVQSYLFFDGRCEEALEFYKKAVGAKVDMLMRNKESPEPPPPGIHPARQNHACRLPHRRNPGTRLGRNVRRRAKLPGLLARARAKDDAEAKRFFGALSEGGQVKMPLTPTFFASSFGMLTDRFGVGWMVLAPKK